MLVTPTTARRLLEGLEGPDGRHRDVELETSDDGGEATYVERVAELRAFVIGGRTFDVLVDITDSADVDEDLVVRHVLEAAGLQGTHRPERTL